MKLSRLSEVEKKDLLDGIGEDIGRRLDKAGVDDGVWFVAHLSDLKTAHGMCTNLPTENQMLDFLKAALGTVERSIASKN